MTLAATDVRVRHAEAADTGVIRDILWTTWVATYGPFIPDADLRSYFDEHYAVERLLGLLVDSHVRLFLAEVNAEAVATMITRYTPEEDRLYVSSLYVLPGAQGKGVGGLLLHEAEKLARGVGVDAIWLGVMVQNKRAVEWYERIGFHFDRREPFVMGTSTVDHFIGCRRLPETPDG